MNKVKFPLKEKLENDHYENEEVLSNGTETLELPNSSFTFFKNPQNGMWTVAQIKYDLVTKKTGTLEVLFEDLNRELGTERFRIIVAETLF